MGIVCIFFFAPVIKQSGVGGIVCMCVCVCGVGVSNLSMGTPMSLHDYAVSDAVLA